MSFIKAGVCIDSIEGKRNSSSAIEETMRGYEGYLGGGGMCLRMGGNLYTRALHRQTGALDTTNKEDESNAISTAVPLTSIGSPRSPASISVFYHSVIMKIFVNLSSYRSRISHIFTLPSPKYRTSGLNPFKSFRRRSGLCETFLGLYRLL
jgi:hypothetical protein